MSQAQYAYNALYELIDGILNADLSLSVPVVQAHQNAPSPKPPYIAIELPSLRPSGHTSSSEVATPSGAIGRIEDWIGETAIWEVGGDGDLLRTIAQRLGFQSTRDFLRQRKMSIFSVPPYTALPRTEELKWVREFRMDLQFGLATQANEILGWIETAEIQPNALGGTQ